jgi:hypothetical protein
MPEDQASINPPLLTLITMKQYRLNRLFNAKSSRCFDVAVDHGFFNQPNFLSGIEDIRKVKLRGYRDHGATGRACVPLFSK